MSTVECRFLDYNYAFDATVTITASSEDPLFPVSNLKHPFRSKVWRSLAETTSWVVLDLKTTDAIDSFAMFFDARLGIKLTPTVEIRLQANATNAWDAPAVDVVVALDQTYEIASHFFTSDQNYRYWRVKITDTGNPYGYTEVGKIVLTKATQLSHGPEIGFQFTMHDPSRATSTDYGNQYFDIAPIRNTLSMDLKYLSYSDIQALTGIFNRLGNVNPLVVALDATAAIYDQDHFLVYGNLVGDLQFQHEFYDMFSTSLAILEAL